MKIWVAKKVKGALTTSSTGSEEDGNVREAVETPEASGYQHPRGDQEESSGVGNEPEGQEEEAGRKCRHCHSLFGSKSSRLRHENKGKCRKEGYKHKGERTTES